MTTETNHRALHNLDASGRDREIEGYVRASVAWFVSQLRNRDIQPAGTLLDVGSDTGFAASLLAEHFPQCRVLALEPHPGPADPVWPLLVMTAEQWCAAATVNKQTVEHVFLNHVLEHLDNPLGTLHTLHAAGMRHLFIAVPDAECATADFVCADGHLHTFTSDWFSGILPRQLPVLHHTMTTRCFRKHWVEAWHYYQLGEPA